MDSYILYFYVKGSAYFVSHSFVVIRQARILFLQQLFLKHFYHFFDVDGIAGKIGWSTCAQEANSKLIKGGTEVWREMVLRAPRQEESEFYREYVHLVLLENVLAHGAGASLSFRDQRSGLQFAMH